MITKSSLNYLCSSGIGAQSLSSSATPLAAVAAAAAVAVPRHQVLITLPVIVNAVCNAVLVLGPHV
jgi:hypothetical protein